MVTARGLRRVLLFGYYFPPLGGAGSQRALSFARHLPALGWEVVVVMPREGVYGRDPSLAAEGLPGVRVRRTGTWEPAVVLKGLRGKQSGPGSGGPGGEFVEEVEVGAVGQAVRTAVRKALYFPDSSRGWIGPAVRAAKAEHSKTPFDIVLSSSPPISAHVAALRFAAAAKVPCVLDFRDLWVAAEAEGESKARTLLGELLAVAAGVTTVSRPYADSLRAAGAGKDPVVVANGWEEDESEKGDGPSAAPAAPFVVHAGSTYAGRQDIGAIARTVVEARANGCPLVLRLLGHLDPEARSAVAPAAAAGAVSVEGFVTQEEVLRVLRSAAAILVVAWSGEGAIARGHLPAKLFDAVHAGRPVILVAQRRSEAERVGRNLGLKAIGPGDSPALREMFCRIGKGEMPPGTLPDIEASREYTRARQAARLAEVLDRVVAEGRR